MGRSGDTTPFVDLVIETQPETAYVEFLLHLIALESSAAIWKYALSPWYLSSESCKQPLTNG